MAPLKQFVLQQGEGRRAVFHGLIAVAPLKLRSARRLSRRHLVFHGLIAVAPLKPGRENKHNSPLAVFHGLIAVAPLKQLLFFFFAPALGCFPRPNSRGPIEANRITARLHDSLSFPRPNSRGPIEASLLNPGFSLATKFSTA